jgi:HEAT repeat protein
MRLLPILDPLLAVLAASFALASLALLLDRLRYDRRTRRASDLRRRLASVPAHALGEDVSLRPLIARLSPADFHQLSEAGLPYDTTVLVARAVRERHGDERLRQDASAAVTPDVWTRLLSLHLLASADTTPEVYEALDEALRSGEPMLAGAAMRLLIRLDDWRSAEVLVRALVDGSCPRARIAAALERMTVPAAIRFEPLFAHPHPAVRAWAARLAARRGLVSLVPAVRRVALDMDAIVRRAAMEALGRFADPADRALVFAGLEDRVPMVRAHAARAAAAFSSEAMAGAVATLLADRAWIVRAAARDALLRLGVVAQGALTRALWHPDRFAANNAAEVLYRSGVIGAIAQRLVRQPLGDPDAADMLARFGEAGGTHLRQALLARFGPDEAVRVAALMHPSGTLVAVRR